MECGEKDLLLKTIIFNVEMALMHEVKVFIVGDSSNYVPCEDGRVVFVNPSDMKKRWRQTNCIVDRIDGYIERRHHSVLSIKELYLLPCKYPVWSTCNSQIIIAGKDRITNIIERINENVRTQSSGAQRFMQMMGNAMFNINNPKSDEIE